MAKILLGWEFGAGRGHYLAVKAAADALADRGHEPVFAVKNLQLFSKEVYPLWQAPVSPRLMVGAARVRRTSASTMGDILARLCFDDHAMITGLMLAWRQILDHIRPDLVIGEFAPLLLLAARGRCPTIHLGTGFTLPPADMGSFPRLFENAPEADEQATLFATNQGLADAGLEPIETLPAAFAADVELVQTFAELDPYRHFRRAPVQPPVVPRWDDSDGPRDELFVYLQEDVPADAAIWHGLAQSRLPVRVHVPNASAEHLETFERSGFTIERQPVPLPKIAERSRLLLSHGGHGFVCSSLLAGIPQIVCYHDLEKRLHADSIAALRLGGHARIDQIQPGRFAESLVELFEDEAITERARAAAPLFRARMTSSFEETVCGEVETLLRG